MDEPHRRQVIEHYLQAYNRFDIDAMLAVLAHNVRFENHSGGQLTMVTEGIDAFGELARHSASLFREREQRLLALEFDGDQAMATIGWRGVFAQDVPDGPRAAPSWNCRARASSCSRVAASNGSLIAAEDRPLGTAVWTADPLAVESAQHRLRVPGKDVRMQHQVPEVPGRDASRFLAAA